MATIVVIPNGTYPAQTRVFGPVAVPTGVVSVTAKIDRTLLSSPTLRIDWNLELSQDGGANWLPWGGAGVVGGSIINPATGLPSTESSCTIALPNQANANRRLRGSVTINETVTTTVSLDVN